MRATQLNCLFLEAFNMVDMDAKLICADDFKNCNIIHGPILFSKLRQLLQVAKVVSRRNDGVLIQVHYYNYFDGKMTEFKIYPDGTPELVLLGNFDNKKSGEMIDIEEKSLNAAGNKKIRAGNMGNKNRRKNKNI